MAAPGIRRLRTSDAEAVLEAFDSGPEMMRQGHVTTLAQAESYIDGVMRAPNHAFAITDDDRLVGVVGVTVDEANRLGWFWYWLNRSHRGRGWASVATTLVANWALSDGGLERLELGHRVDNPLSGNVAAAAGFIHEGRERGKFLVDGERVDVLAYGRLRSDPWPPDPEVASRLL